MEVADTMDMVLPFNDDTFQNKVNQFYALIKELTLQDVEASPEERRQTIAGKY